MLAKERRTKFKSRCFSITIFLSNIENETIGDVANPALNLAWNVRFTDCNQTTAEIHQLLINWNVSKNMLRGVLECSNYASLFNTR